MELYYATLSGKIRERYPESPVEKDRRQIGKVTNRTQPPVVYSEVAGVKARNFAALPTGLWNEVTSLLGATLKEAARSSTALSSTALNPTSRT